MSEPFFFCENCHTKYLFDAEQIGATICCDVCGHVGEAPEFPFQEAPPMEQGTGRWFLLLGNGRQFGPVLPAVIEEWVSEGRADEASLVAEEGTGRWVYLAEAFPGLVPRESKVRNDFAPVRLAIAELSGRGVLESIADEFEELSGADQRRHEGVVQMVQRECQRTMGAVRVRGWKSIRVGDYVVFGESKRMAAEARPESLTIIALAAKSSEFYLVVPWAKLGRLAHEFFSVLPGRLPSSIALRRLSEDAFEGGQWVGISGTEDDVLAVAAKRTQEDLARGIRWQWYSEDGGYMMVIVWGLQAVPLGSDKFLHVMQTASMGPAEQDFGLMWYLDRQSAFYRFSRNLSIPDDHETHFLFSTSSGQLLSHMLS